jgi:hypothetical protein
VGLAEERLADEPDRGASISRLDRRSQAGAAGPDDKDVVGMPLWGVVHRWIAGSTMIPSASSRT